MDKEEARRLLSAFVEELKKRPYAELQTSIRNPDVVLVTGETGSEYHIEYEAIWDTDPGGLLRVVASIDDGGLLTSLSPPTIGFLIDSDGVVVG